MIEKIAQLWCQPKHSHMEMDVDFAHSIYELFLKDRTKELLSRIVADGKELLAITKDEFQKQYIKTIIECSYYFMDDVDNPTQRKVDK